MLGELVQTAAGKWNTHPPIRSPNGHALGPGEVLVGHQACPGHGGGHTTCGPRAAPVTKRCLGRRSTVTARHSTDPQPCALHPAKLKGPESHGWRAGSYMAHAEYLRKRQQERHRGPR